jgi:hypothetical protein
MDIAEMLVVEAGVRGDISAFTPEPQVSARTSVIFHQENYSIRLTGGSAYRNPTYVEAGSRFVHESTGIIQLDGNGKLAPPRVMAVELGGIVGLFENRIILRPTFYLARASDLVVGDTEPVIRRTFRNDFREVDFLGGELELDWQISDHLVVKAAGMLLHFLSEEADPSASVGNENHNSDVSARLGARAELLDDRLTLAGSVAFFSSRLWNVSAGIPPTLQPKKEVPNLFRFELSAEWKLSDRLPMWLRLQVMSHLPHDTAESVYPNGGLLGTGAFLSWQYRIM